jgi:hypothetical protein
MKTILAGMVALAMLVATASTSQAQCDKGCDTGCGADAAGGSACGPCKVCKLVKVEKVVKTVCYGVKCKDICVPGCGSGCTKVKCACCGDKPGCCDDCSARGNCKVCVATGKPGCCATKKTVKQLVKYERSVTICSYEWQVVDAGEEPGCGAEDNGCDAGCDSGNGGDDVPAAPTPAAGA